MTTRTITGTLVGRPRASVMFRQRATFVTTDATYLATTYAATADSAGDFSIDLPVPDSGSILYRVELPDGAAADVYLGAGSATTLELLLAGAFAASGSPDILAVLESLVDANAATIASTTVLGHVKIDGTTITIDGSGVISSTGGGGGGGGAPSGPAGGVLGGTYPNPTFAADMATQAELDAEASTRASADTTLQSNITAEASTRAAADTTNAGNLTTHAALTTSAHGGIVASNDSRLTDSRTPTAHASTHASAGSDPLTLAQSQITGLTAALAALQPLDSDLTAIAALSTTSFGRGLLALADAAALRTTAGLGTAAQADTGTGAANVPTITQADARYQPLDSDLTAIAALSTTSFGRSLLAAADAAALRTLAGLGSLATASSITASQISDASANGRSLMTAADYAAMRTLLALVVGTNVQAWDADLDAIAALTSAADKLPYATGAQAWALTTLTSFIRTLLDDADAATARTTLGAAASVSLGRVVIGGTNQLTLPGVSASSVGTVALVNNQIRYFPIIVATSMTFDQISLEVTTAAAASTTIRTAIYNADTDWLPTSLVVDAGTVAADSLGQKSATINQTLAPGRYLMAINSDGTPTLRMVRGTLAHTFIRSTVSASPIISAFTVTSAYAAFAGTGVATSGQTNSTLPIEYVTFLRISTP